MQNSPIGMFAMCVGLILIMFSLPISAVTNISEVYWFNIIAGTILALMGLKWITVEEKETDQGES